MAAPSKKVAYRYCSGCGKRIDNDTGLCPTPEACAAHRRPHQRIAAAERERQAQVAAAERAHAEPAYDRRPTGDHAPRRRWAAGC